MEPFLAEQWLTAGDVVNFMMEKLKTGAFSDSDPKSSAPATERIDRLETESSTQNLYLCMSDRCEESFDTVQI
jgi:hypothetical protein